MRGTAPCFAGINVNAEGYTRNYRVGAGFTTRTNAISLQPALECRAEGRGSAFVKMSYLVRRGF